MGLGGIKVILHDALGLPILLFCCLEIRSLVRLSEGLEGISGEQTIIPKYTLPLKYEAFKKNPNTLYMCATAKTHVCNYCTNSFQHPVVLGIRQHGRGGADYHCPALGNQAEASNLEVWSPHTSSTVIGAWLKPLKGHSEQEINLGDTTTLWKSL